MVSPFMSFATGALQAVDKNIDRYRETKAEEERAKTEQERLMERLQFERETKLEVAGVNKEAAIEAANARITANTANKFTKIGGFNFQKHADPTDRVNSHLATITANPQEAARLLSSKNPEEQSAFKKLLFTVYNDSQKAFRDPAIPGQPAPPQILFTAKFSQQLADPALKSVRRFFADLESGVLNENARKNMKIGTEAIGRRNGIPVQLEGGPVVNNAIKKANAVRYRSMAGSQSDRINTVANIIGGDYDKTKKAWEGKNKFYTAWNSPFVEYISSGRKFETPELEKAASEWLYDPRHGFVDEDGLLNSNVRILVNLYGNQNSELNTGQGNRPRAKAYRNYIQTPQGKNREEEVAEIRKSLPLARAALQSTTGLIKAIKGSEAPSSALQFLVTALPKATGLLRGAQGVINQALNTTRGLGVLSTTKGRVDKRYNPEGKSAYSLIQDSKDKYTKAVSKAGGNLDDRAVKVARAQMLEMALAYQLTGILQGGTGGRTISDTDITRTLQMLGGTYDTMKMRRAKLAEVKKLIVGHINRSSLYRLITPDSNAGLFFTVEKVSGIINPYNKDNYDTKIVQDSKVPPPKPAAATGQQQTPTDSRSEMMARWTSLKLDNSPPRKTMEDLLYHKDLARKALTISKSDDGNFAIVPFDGIKQWGIAVKRYSSEIDKPGANREALERGLAKKKEEILKKYPSMLDLSNNAVVEIDYIIEDGVGKYDIKEQKASNQPPAPTFKKTDAQSSVEKLFTPSSTTVDDLVTGYGR